jgi:hypothetical protein
LDSGCWNITEIVTFLNSQLTAAGHAITMTYIPELFAVSFVHTSNRPFKLVGSSTSILSTLGFEEMQYIDPNLYQVGWASQSTIALDNRPMLLINMLNLSDARQCEIPHISNTCGFVVPILSAPGSINYMKYDDIRQDLHFSSNANDIGYLDIELRRSSDNRYYKFQQPITILLEIEHQY